MVKRITGEVFTFDFDTDKKIGCGGNGEVYDALIRNPSVEGEYVVKFFCYKGKPSERLERRYRRFKREVEQVGQLSDIKGIIPVIDKYCPEVWKDEFSAWYLMPKATVFPVSQGYNPREILKEMYLIAITLKELHQHEIAHRDIKPTNLMFYKERLCLIDFGLLWSNDLEPITTIWESLGPYKIHPPEFESYTKLDNDYIDYRFSDVYLFAKVLWIYLTGNKNGFKGPYTRNREKIYLSRHDSIRTYEPLHQLLEQATLDNWSDRIDIQECMKLIKLQIEIIENSNSENLNWIKIINQNIYSENTKKLIADKVPSIKEYTDEEIISQLISSVLDCSEAYIKNTRTDKETVARFIDYQKVEAREKEYIFTTEIGRTIIRYHIKPSKARYKTKNEEIEILLSDIPSGDISYSEVKTLSEKRNEDIYLSSEESICFRRYR